MKPGLQIGERFEFSIQVREEMQPQFEGQVIHPLYSTAAMINHMEWAARQHILPYLEPDEEGAGYQIDLKHLAATPLGAIVKIRSTVTQVSALKVTSQVEAWHGETQIGSGTLVQAVVPKAKLYQQPSSAFEKQVMPAEKPPEPAGEPEEALAPPPAELLAADGKSGLAFEVLKWETGYFPCSRYDEWLVCKLIAFQNGQSDVFEGPFLLRHEIDEWLEAAENLSARKQSGFQSDFLEPVLRLAMAAGELGNIYCTVQLTPAQDESLLNSTPNPPLTLKLEVSEKALAFFARQLAEQLDGLPSRL